MTNEIKNTDKNEIYVVDNLCAWFLTPMCVEIINFLHQWALQRSWIIRMYKISAYSGGWDWFPLLDKFFF